MKFTQQPVSLIMVRPQSFGYNTETSGSNVFQRNDLADVETALEEFDRMIDTLESQEIEIRIFEDTPTPSKPDAVFPNNWITTHPEGVVILYPMMAPNRRAERRVDIVEFLKEKFLVSRVLDLSDEENNGAFLEGTGSMVFDYVNRLIYACRSPRTSEVLVNRVAAELGYTAIIFDAVDEHGRSIYHTNVMMAIGEKFVLLCLDAVKDDEQQEKLLDSFVRTGHRVVAISYVQMNAFAGNTIEVKTTNGESVVLMSQTGFQSLLPGQINAISQFADIVPVAVPTIEKIGGGSVRCMVLDVHLPARNN